MLDQVTHHWKKITMIAFAGIKDGSHRGARSSPMEDLYRFTLPSEGQSVRVGIIIDEASRRLSTFPQVAEGSKNLRHTVADNVSISLAS